MAFAHAYYRQEEQQRLQEARNEVATSSQQTSRTREGLDKDIDESQKVTEMKDKMKKDEENETERKDS